MSGEPVLIRELGVHRMPGVPRSLGFVVDGLCPGVNVVIGRNGSGKTTMVRAIEEIFWPGHDRLLQPSLAGTVTIEGTTWQVEIEGRSVSWRREGAETAAPDVGTPELRHRYRLALAEMVNATERDVAFAAEVSRAMIGGFDLDLIASNGSYGSRPRGITTRRNTVHQARQGLEEAMRLERWLEQRRVRDLPDLERSLENSRSAERLKQACARGIERRNAIAEINRLKTERGALPVEQLRICHANDRTALDGLERRRDELASRRDQLRRAIEAATEQLGPATIPDDGVQASEFDQVESQRAVIEDHERRRAHLRSERPGVKEERDTCFGRLESIITEDQVNALSSMVADAEAETLARSAHRMAGEREALVHRRNVLPDIEDLGEAESITKLQEGYHALGRWMAVARPAAARNPWRNTAVLLLVVLGGGLSLVAAVAQHWLWATALVAIAVLAWLAWRDRPSADPDLTARRETFRAEYDQLRIDGPVGWTTDGVVERMRQLAQQVIRAQEAQSQRDEHRELDRVERDLGRRETELREHRAELERRLGIALPGDEAWLPVFTSSLRRWQETHDRLRRIDAEISSLNQSIEATLGEAARIISPFGEPRPTDSATLRSACDRLRELDRVARSRTADRAELSERVAPSLTGAETAKSEFFVERGLADGDVDGLDRLIDLLADLAELDRNIDQVRGAVDGAATALEDHPDLLELAVEELEARQEQSEREASRRDEFVQKIDRIQQGIARARGDHTVADARSALTAALDALETDCLMEGRAAVGQMLLERIRAVSRESSLPAVFDRSRHLFARITAGRFELRLPQLESSHFRAYDNVDGVEKTVDQLSTGERVQLLLAVRLGFLEHQERYPMPLLLDETLGTSDDDRVREIMDALIDIARDGRQILYFTAQQDEAGKWAARLAAAGQTLNLVDLDTLRRGGRQQVSPLEIQAIEVTRVPHFGDHDHAAYGRELNVPGLNPFCIEVSQVHLWHIIDDNEQLYMLLSRSIGTTGQFLTYQQYGGQLPAGLGEDLSSCVATKVRGLKRLFEAWRQGRSRPIDFQELLDTGAISATFESRLAELFDEVHHDPVALLRALEAQRLARWHSTNTDLIREKLQDSGALAEGDPLDAAELEIRLRAALSQAIESGLVGTSWIRRVVASLPDLSA